VALEPAAVHAVAALEVADPALGARSEGRPDRVPPALTGVSRTPRPALARRPPAFGVRSGTSRGPSGRTLAAMRCDFSASAVPTSRGDGSRDSRDHDVRRFDPASG
jgi:hypothetical protein